MSLTKRQILRGGAMMAGGAIASGSGAEVLFAQTAEAPGVPGISLPARFIPVPKSVSPEAQAILAAGRGALAMLGGAKPVAGAPVPAGPKVTEHKLSHSTLYEIEPLGFKPASGGKALYYIHGGGYTSGGGIAAANSAFGMAELTGLRTWSIDYRMPPQAVFPAAVDDAVEAYRFLLAKVGAKNIATYGPSAGGGLIVACLLKARDLGLPLPTCCVAHSPEADLTESGDSFETNLGMDPLLSSRGTKSNLAYAGGHDLRDPYLSPLFGDFTKGFPPTSLTTGTRDLFLSNTVLLHKAMRRAGVTVDLNVGEAAGHGGFFGRAPEDHETLAEQANFIRRYLKIA